ncbi:MAG TPA: hypothetical protein VGV38_15395 [Pyrinomonadaceae bacterium]|nr:hypothetical protein [Pyrinomonadaceae bacterium]
MLIRREQMRALEEVRMPEFEDFMVAHLREFSPLHSKSLGEAGIRALVNVGVGRARQHMFTHRATVKFYIETMILLGVDFDTDPQYPRAGEILRDASAPDQVERADRVHAWLIELLDAAGGPGRRYARQALQRAREIVFEPIPASDPDFEERVIGYMKQNHPEKAAYVGDENLKGLIPRAVEETRKYSVHTDAGVCLFLGLMFAVGHGFAVDPKYPWAHRTLTNPAIKDPDKRVERLHSKTMTYLDRVLQHLQVT